MLTNLDIDAVEIRLPEQVEDIDGLIIPGGESTTIAQLLDIFDIKNSISCPLPAPHGACP